MRFFVALEVPDQNRIQLHNVQQKIKEIVPQARLTDNNKLHLTLAFIGEQPEELKEKLVESISKVANGIPQFEVTPAYIDGFPTIHNPHTLWVGVKGDVDKLIILGERLKDQLKNLNLPVDQRRFIPHIAIAKLVDTRVNDITEVSLEKIMAQHFEPIKVTQIKLFESTPDGSFHTHNTLATIKLD